MTPADFDLVILTSGDRLMPFFRFAHLPPTLQALSQKFATFASELVVDIPASAERTVALRKLLESKDCAVRALLTLLLVILVPALAMAQTITVLGVGKVAMDIPLTGAAAQLQVYKAYVPATNPTAITVTATCTGETAPDISRARNTGMSLVA